MLSVSAGGLAIAKYTLAPHMKITIVIRNGTTVQPISSMTLPWIRSPTASGERRRYFTAKYTIRPAISREKKAVTATRNRYNASTREAIVDAPKGNRGVPEDMFRTCLVVGGQGLGPGGW